MWLFYMQPHSYLKPLISAHGIALGSELQQTIYQCIQVSWYTSLWVGFSQEVDYQDIQKRIIFHPLNYSPSTWVRLNKTEF